MDYQLGPGPLQVDQNTIDEKIKGDIGIVENGDVATHAIPSGYYVIWKGDLYVAKTDISSGTTLSTSNLTAKPNGLGADVAALNSKLTSTADTIDSFISVFQSDTAVHNVRIASGTLATTLYGNAHSGACTGFRVSDYVVYSAFDSDGMFVTGWVDISQRTATFSRPIKYIDYSGEFAITTADDGVFYKEISRDVLGIPNNATLLFAQFTTGFLSSEILSITSNSTKLFIMARTSRTVTRAIRVFYLG